MRVGTKLISKIKLAFTLIELLVVVTIIGILASMLLAVASGADDKNSELETRLLISNLVAGCEQFTNLTGQVPMPTGKRSNPLSGSWYPSDNLGSWEKQQLWWRLSAEMSAAHKRDAEARAQAESVIANPYQSWAYLKSQNPTMSDNALKTKRKNIFDTEVSDAEAELHLGTSTNRGHLQGIKEKILNKRGLIARDIGARKYQSMPILQVEDIGSEYLKDDTIIDLWGNPLIYVARSIRGVKYVKPWTWGGEEGVPIGAAPQGRYEVDDRNQDGVINDEDWIVEPTANKKKDWNEDSVIDEKDWDNILYNARPSNGRGVYIASAGPDGMFHCLRTQPENKDNIENKLEDE